MTNEELKAQQIVKTNKELLLKDLCARLPYNPIVEYKGENYNVLGVVHGRLVLCKSFMSHTLDECPLITEVKPYLFPLESMTEEQEAEYNDLNCYELGLFPHTEAALDYLIKHHFDYRGLIDTDLANDATGLNIY